MSSTDPPVPDPNETAPGGDDPATRTLPLEEALEAGIEPLQGKDEALELLWSKVLEHWDEDKVHTAFLEYARERFLLPEAGARYRQIKETDPERAELAQKKLGQLMTLALALLESAREPVRSGPPRWITSLAYAVAAVFVAVLIRKVFVGR